MLFVCKILQRVHPLPYLDEERGLVGVVLKFCVLFIFQIFDLRKEVKEADERLI